MKFPRLPVRRVESPARRRPATRCASGPTGWRSRPPARSATARRSTRRPKRRSRLPKTVVEQGEIVFRARGDNMRDQGIEDGDLLVVEIRPRGRASTGELVIGRIGKHRLRRPLVAEARPESAALERPVRSHGRPLRALAAGGGGDQSDRADVTVKPR